MTYTLLRLAPGSYDVLLDGVVMASLVRSAEASRIPDSRAMSRSASLISLRH
jgi:hypothetical protein